MSIYTVYQLNEKRNKLGNPYIGFTENLIRRSKQWKKKLQLDYIPELICLYTDTSAQRAFDWEQDKRVENGWRRERPLRHLRTIAKKAHKKLSKLNSNYEHQCNAGKIGGKIQGLKNKESGQIQSISSYANQYNGGFNACLIERTCTYCNKTIKGPSYFKWHGDKCKAKPN